MKEMTWFGIWLSYKIQKLRPNIILWKLGDSGEYPTLGLKGLNRVCRRFQAIPDGFASRKSRI